MIKNYIIILIWLSLMACKEDEPVVSGPTPSETISRTWKVQSVTINGQADNVADYNNFRFTFNPDQTYRFTMPDIRQGNWELNPNATALALDKGTDQEQRVTVLKLTETALDMEFTEEHEKTGTRRMLFDLIP